MKDKRHHNIIFAQLWLCKLWSEVKVVSERFLFYEVTVLTFVITLSLPPQWWYTVFQHHRLVLQVFDLYVSGIPQYVLSLYVFFHLRLCLWDWPYCYAIAMGLFLLLHGIPLHDYITIHEQLSNFPVCIMKNVLCKHYCKCHLQNILGIYQGEVELLSCMYLFIQSSRTFPKSFQRGWFYQLLFCPEVNESSGRCEIILFLFFPFQLWCLFFSPYCTCSYFQEMLNSIFVMNESWILSTEFSSSTWDVRMIFTLFSMC